MLSCDKAQDAMQPACGPSCLANTLRNANDPATTTCPTQNVDADLPTTCSLLLYMSAYVTRCHVPMP